MNKPLDEKALEAAAINLQADAFVYGYPATDIVDAEKLAETAIRKYLEAKQAGESEAVGWRDISRAPKDGTWFIARQNGETYPCQWHTDEPDEGAAREGWYDLFNRSFEEPTEWCPAPPSFAAVQAENERLRAALEKIAEEEMFRSGYGQTDFDTQPVLSAEEMQFTARAALAGQEKN